MAADLKHTNATIASQRAVRFGNNAKTRPRKARKAVIEPNSYSKANDLINGVVVGSGIGGLACGIALTAKGHNVTILEATKQMQAIGGIIVCFANTGRVLDQWGVYGSLLKICRDRPFRGSFKDRHGNQVARGPNAAMDETYGYKMWTLHRADYHRVLYEAALERGVKVRVGCPVVSVDETVPSVTIKGGEVVKADLIVGVDGTKSVVRDAINTPEQRGVVDTGRDVTRFNLPFKFLEEDEDLAFLNEHYSLWGGPELGIAQVPMLHQGEWWNGFDFHHPRWQHSRPERAVPMSLPELRDWYKDWNPLVQKLFDFCEDTAAKAKPQTNGASNGDNSNIFPGNAAFDRLESSPRPKYPIHVWQMPETLPEKWASGHVALVGDAAHSMLPWAGQGSGMALEDAATLAECLERYDPSNDSGPKIPELLCQYQDLRKPRCKLVQSSAHDRAIDMMLPDGPAQESRNKKMKENWAKLEQNLARFAASKANASFVKPTSEYAGANWDPEVVDKLPSVNQGPEYLLWQDGFDAIGFAKRRLDEIYGPKPVIYRLEDHVEA
ncbi:3-hydroxybenzoate 6-hydroxylase [Cyphellophora attinorum]|uniref:3-hydroxybenzoate 6-hydroxylase n=1 Tax=Cyphellophora attinorum TaxID=1664694 RepID=A0A0N1H2V7_9EURO|nr:3-hydroxybenzoate 6-hydroxylase [Phialophora attinorum]KPI34546.1 3-hydroxybenzoate 6-hydroxylase [Phialophora attinorum]